MDSINYPEKSKNTTPFRSFDSQGKENLRTHCEQLPQKMWQMTKVMYPLCTVSVPRKCLIMEHFLEGINP